MSFRAGSETGRANLEVFSQTLMDLAQADPQLRVVTSDSRGSGKLLPYAQAFPEQLVEVGIAEQNLVGISAGLASTGKTVFAVSPASFLTARSLEQIKNDVCYADHPVTLVGISAGVSYGALGSTHHSLHDLAALRAIHNIAIVVPADNLETAAAVRAAADLPQPVYLRFGKRPLPHLHAPDTEFEIGKAITIRDGRDLAFIANGETVCQSLAAAEILAEAGLTCRVLSMHTVKPLDAASVLTAARECRAVITVEEHHAYGGLGEACAAVLMQAGLAVPFKVVGLPDVDTATGSQLEIFNHYGISPAGLVESAREILDIKRASGDR
jgi:transketolase